MRGPFVRRCFEHPQEPVESSISDTGYESVWCRSGHRARSWYVVDKNEKKVAVGHLNAAPMILDPGMMSSLKITSRYLVIQPAPERDCKRGHPRAWQLQADGSYKCETCRKEQYEINKDKIKARYVANRMKLGLPVNVRKKGKKRKNV